MSIDTLGGSESTPGIDRFSAIDANERLHKQFRNKNSHEHVYASTIASCETHPPALPGSDSVVNLLSSKKSRGINGGAEMPAEVPGFFDRLAGYARSTFDKIGSAVRAIYNSAYNYVWGISPKGNNHIASEVAMSEAQRKRISDAMDAMIKSLERIQEVAREDGAEQAASEDKQRLFSFIEILKLDSKILKEQLLNNAENVDILNKAARENQKASREIREKMYGAEGSSAIANKCLTVSDFFLKLSIICNGLALFALIRPELAAAAKATSWAALGASGTFKFARTIFDGTRIKHEAELDIIKNANQKHDVEMKYLSQDMNVLNQNMGIPDTYIAELIRSLESLKNSMLDFENKSSRGGH